MPKQADLNTLNIINELTEFSIPDADKSLNGWIPLVAETAMNTFIHTFKLNSGVHMSIHEAALTDYAAMTLVQPTWRGIKGQSHALLRWHYGKNHAGFSPLWQTIQTANQATGLVNSDLILNLNEPNKWSPCFTNL